MITEASQAAEDKDELLLGVILAMIAPLLTAGGLVSLGDARAAARHAIDSHKAALAAELVTIGQIVGFAMAGLDTLRQSAATSVSMMNRLRATANSLTRSSERAHVALARQRGEAVEHPGDGDEAPDDEEELLAALAETTGLVDQASGPAETEAEISTQAPAVEPAAEIPTPLPAVGSPRHGRPWGGHPRLRFAWLEKTWMAGPTTGSSPVAMAHSAMTGKTSDGVLKISAYGA
jgi:hypothetical protein